MVGSAARELQASNESIERTKTGAGQTMAEAEHLTRAVGVPVWPSRVRQPSAHADDQEEGPFDRAHGLRLEGAERLANLVSPNRHELVDHDL